MSPIFIIIQNPLAFIFYPEAQSHLKSTFKENTPRFAFSKRNKAPVSFHPSQFSIIGALFYAFAFFANCKKY